MYVNFIKILILILLTTPIAMSDDLCLLEINSQNDLEVVEKYIDYSHGIIDNKFIIHINLEKYEILTNKDISIDRLKSDFDMEKLYLVAPHGRAQSTTAISLSPLYSDNFFSLIELERSGIGILRKAKYTTVAIDNLKTPFFYHPPLYPAPMPDSFPTDTLADLINQDSLYSYVLSLQNFQTRFCASDSILSAANWVMEKFLDFGYLDENIYLTPFKVTDIDEGVYNQTCYNVICVKPGTERPDEIIIIGAHYDSISHDEQGSLVWAPGADDNASGCAAVLELARIYSQMDFKKTVVFVLFSAEEVGRHGSMYMADSLRQSGANVEVMINFDLLGYTRYADPGLQLYAWQTAGYYNVAVGAADRVSDLETEYVYYAMSSDDYSFTIYGFFNLAFREDVPFTTIIHGSYDLIDSLNSNYMERIVRSGAATIPIIDQAASDPPEVTVRDFGDGQTLRIEWSDCLLEYDYKIVYSDSSWFLGNTIDVTEPTDCIFNLSGLDEGTMYYVSVMGTPPDGHGSLGLVVDSAQPYFLPLPPQDFKLELDSGQLYMNWDLNEEYDFSHYKVIRKVNNNPWETLADNYLDTLFTDNSPVVHEENTYIVLAVDNDGNASDSTSQSTATPPTFDRGILLVEETQSGGVNPLENQQTVFYNSVLDSQEFYKIKIDSSDETLTRSMAGQFNPIFWVDDDNLIKNLENSIDSLKWYLSQNTDFFLTGWSTIYSMTGQSYFYPGDFFYDQLGISYIAENPSPDFVGPEVASISWPPLELKPDAPGSGRMPNIDRFAATPEAEVIYTFNSYSANPAYDNKPVGVVIDTYHGKRVVLGFPLYWLTEASAQALITRVLEYFAEESTLYGDVNGDWSINILDVTALIGYLYQSGEPPADMNSGDPNGDCFINILDIAYFISYLYKGGSAPIEGCVY